MHVGILGGTGPQGSGVAARLAVAGCDVTIGSRSVERAQEAVTALQQRWPDRNLSVEAGDNPAAAGADVVIIATPWDAAASTAVAVSGQLCGKVTICMANALLRVNKEFQPLIPPRGSVAGHLQAVCPETMVSGALHHIPATALADLDHPVESDVLICSDHDEARKVTGEIVDMIPDLRPLDAGSISFAAPVEAFTAVLLHLNVRYKGHSALRITGIDP